MELMKKQGYKQTEVGLIPEDWIVIPQKDAVKYINGRAYSITEWEATGIPVVRLQNLTQKGGNFYYSNLNLPEYQYMYNGDLIFMWSASFGPYIWWGDKAIFHYHIWKIECNKKVTVKDFYYHKLVQLTDDLKKGMSGSTMLHLTKSGMEKYLFALPPTLTEQKAIATALSDVDALISSLEQGITKKKAIKQGAMQELLTPPHKGGKRLPGFSGEWVEKTLGEYTDLITKGTTPTSLGKPFTSEGINFIKAQSIHKTGNIINEKVAHIDLDTHDLLGRSKMKNKDLLFTIAGVLGRVGIIREENLPANTNQAVAIIRLKKSLSLSVSFFFHVLRAKTIEKHIEAISVQGAQANFSLTDVSNIPLTLPAFIDEQKAIAQILSDMDAEIAQLEAKKAKYQAIKQGMMQELLTGKTRLV